MHSKYDHSVKMTIKTPAQFLASGFGSGCAPVAPGTFGTLAAVPFWFAMTYLPDLWYAVITAFVFVLGCIVSDQASRELNVHDHGGIVIDEFVGFFITMFLVPANIYTAILGFVLFRIFDVIKPWPIQWVDQKMKGGIGIMVDDVLAGIMALISIHLILWGYAVLS
ncbi:phosphatidylglycerophosphatase A [Wohlfahrtiimonas chitiniclastica]|uniref:phosphatidylglycerophosphatase A family protein n=1 Tax=Wohlfahrtiimonas chitiniclastica TaxID=400946 RepID=UPI001BD06AA9|nr:phosphatidylglycerophosphatase A [Wohlfahrtiimonas chitiniclastica]MBS7834553.1 phosphatidylglycerophosphatase A [Wohlfahrtiimonas chitiniclastica]